jgi:hypothetical protein
VVLEQQKVHLWSNVNLEIVRQDMVGGLRDMQIKFVEEFDSGVAYPKSDKQLAVSIMVMCPFILQLHKNP